MAKKGKNKVISYRGFYLEVPPHVFEQLTSTYLGRTFIEKRVKECVDSLIENAMRVAKEQTTPQESV
jgi:hypothetical protein